MYFKGKSGTLFMHAADAETVGEQWAGRKRQETKNVSPGMAFVLAADQHRTRPMRHRKP